MKMAGSRRLAAPHGCRTPPPPPPSTISQRAPTSTRPAQPTSTRPPATHPRAPRPPRPALCRAPAHTHLRDHINPRPPPPRARPSARPPSTAVIFEAPWLVDGGHGASLRQPFGWAARAWIALENCLCDRREHGHHRRTHARAPPPPAPRAHATPGGALAPESVVGMPVSVRALDKSTISTRTEYPRELAGGWRLMRVGDAL
eukprot:COSAG01_NODE_3809_length_5675_cov_5.163349_6_plen_202_part_00